LPEAGGTDDQHQAARGHDDVLQHLRQLQLLDRRDHAADRADHHADFAALLEDVDAEAAGFGQGQRHVQFEVTLEQRNLALVHQRVCDLLDHARRQAGIAEGIQLAFDLDVYRCAGRQEHVRRVLFRHQLQEIADVHASNPYSCAFTPATLPVASVASALRQWPGVNHRHGLPNASKLRTNPISAAGCSSRFRTLLVRVAAPADR